MIIPQLWWFNLCGQLWVDVVTVTDVVHSAATTGDDALNLLGLIYLGWLVPVCTDREKKILLIL